ncbi:hypothetical protein BDZ97DRAFT_1791285 [Flammula alnicola]|nr:hypothetical protein BDZ97DRAFT_1791285 [Flammula alnicola]
MALTGVHLFHSFPLDRRSQLLFGFFHIVGIVATCLVYGAIGMFVRGSSLCPSLTFVYFRASESTRRHVIELSSSTSLSLIFLFTALFTFIAVSVL